MSRLGKTVVLVSTVAVALLVAVESTARQKWARLVTHLIRHGDGPALIVDLDSLAGPLGTWRGYTSTSPTSSTLQLLEDGVPLGPAHSVHQLIAEAGGCMYSH